MTELYLEYIGNYEKLLDLFGAKQHRNQQLTAFLREKRREKKPLSGFLILPVQRIPRYILLLRDLKKNTAETASDYEASDDRVDHQGNRRAEGQNRKPLAVHADSGGIER